MNTPEIIQLRDGGGIPFLAGKEVKEIHGVTVISGKAALPITTSHSFNRTSDVIVSCNNTAIGRIKFLAQSHRDDVFSSPDEEVICFFMEYESVTIIDSKHEFKNDFLLLEEQFLQEYLVKHKETSPIWGSFFHIENLPSISFTKKRASSNIEIVEGIRINSLDYYNNLFLAITEPNPFNRFLKLYHLLELQFDLHTALKIRTLLDEGGREREISSWLKDYSTDEDKRLESLIRERCTDIEKIADLLGNIHHHKSVALKIFYEYGRTTNPLKKSDFITLHNNPPMFDRSRVDALGGHTYNILIQRLATHWIYRVRCCIAHNKYGEYLMNHTDEELIVEFAEPLLKEVVIQCFKI